MNSCCIFYSKKKTYKFLNRTLSPKKYVLATCFSSFFLTFRIPFESKNNFSGMEYIKVKKPIIADELL